jgi:hypothetical protein
VFGIRGYSSSVHTACASGGQAVGTALKLIRRGEADCVLAGGVLISGDNEPGRGSTRLNQGCFAIQTGPAVGQLRPLDGVRANQDLRQGYCDAFLWWRNVAPFSLIVALGLWVRLPRRSVLFQLIEAVGNTHSYTRSS